MSLLVHRPGLQTTFQDLGRPGLEHLGIATGGAVDRTALRIANWLVGNRDRDLGLEITLLGPELEAETDVVVACTGATLDLRLDGRLVAMGRPLVLRRGSRLDLGAARCGARAYLAVAGGLLADEVLGSRSRHTLANLGTVLERSSRLRCRPRPADLGDAAWSVAGAPPPRAGHTTRLRFVAAEGLGNLLDGARYRVGHDGDRMALRLDLLEGMVTTATTSPGRTTEPVAFGTIQQPPDGRLAILLADRQTTGGYPRLGAIASADRSQLAQLPPGALVVFEAISWAEAVDLAVAHERELAKLELAIALARNRGARLTNTNDPRARA